MITEGDEIVLQSLIDIIDSATDLTSLEYEWRITDPAGTIEDLFGSAAQYQFTNDGDYLLEVRVADDDEPRDALSNVPVRWRDAVDGGWVTIPNPIIVGQQDPQSLAITGLPVGDVTEGTIVILGSSFTDAGVNDTHEYQWTISSDNGLDFSDVELVASDLSFTVAQEGSYTVSLFVRDADDASSTASITETISVVNEVPTIDLPLSVVVAAEGGETNLVARFTDPGALDSYTGSIDWGDDTSPTEFTLPAGATLVRSSHVYANDDDYTITLTINDGTGQSRETFEATVDNVIPTLLSIDTITPVAEGGTLALSGSAVDLGTDDNQTLQFFWDIEVDGTYHQVIPPNDAAVSSPENASGTVSWSDLVAIGIDDGPATYNVRIAGAR